MITEIRVEKMPVKLQQLIDHKEQQIKKSDERWEKRNSIARVESKNENNK